MENTNSLLLLFTSIFLFSILLQSFQEAKSRLQNLVSPKKCFCPTIKSLDPNMKSCSCSVIALQNSSILFSIKMRQWFLSLFFFLFLSRSILKTSKMCRYFCTELSLWVLLMGMCLSWKHLLAIPNAPRRGLQRYLILQHIQL
ncbi:hypothetical protein BDF14DRAFT_1782714 [Spinellus fusiger]|nr:hypothetical protein BDF14DRAFT_1782714 [Spinellus fusiger]